MSDCNLLNANNEEKNPLLTYISCAHICCTLSHPVSPTKLSLNWMQGPMLFTLHIRPAVGSPTVNVGVIVILMIFSNRVGTVCSFQICLPNPSSKLYQYSMTAECSICPGVYFVYDSNTSWSWVTHHLKRHMAALWDSGRKFGSFLAAVFCIL